VRFKLGAHRRYTPDFLVEFADGRRFWVDVKGYTWQRDAVRLDWFVEQYPGEALWVVTRPSKAVGWQWKRVGSCERTCPIVARGRKAEVARA
jgi:hypothetical protein